MAGGRSLAETPAQGVSVSAWYSIHSSDNGAIDPLFVFLVDRCRIVLEISEYCPCLVVGR